MRGNFRPREGQVQRPGGGSWLRNFKEDEGLEQSGEGRSRGGVVHGVRCRAFVGPCNTSLYSVRDVCHWMVLSRGGT